MTNARKLTQSMRRSVRGFLAPEDWKTLALFAACGSMLLNTPRVSAQEIAEGGSPLYSIAVVESIQNLRGREQSEANPAGEVCPHCGKVHARVPAVSTNQADAVSNPLPAAPGKPCPVCGQIHPQTTAVSTNGPATAAVAPGGSGAYYYCTNCKVYHRRQPTMPSVTLPEEHFPLMTSTNRTSSRP